MRCPGSTAEDTPGHPARAGSDSKFLNTFIPELVTLSPTHSALCNPSAVDVDGVFCICVSVSALALVSFVAVFASCIRQALTYTTCSGTRHQYPGVGRRVLVTVYAFSFIAGWAKKLRYLLTLLSSAHAAYTVPVSSWVDIFAFKQVPVDAVSLSRIGGTSTYATESVLPVSDWLQMVWVYACGVTAKVIKDQPIGYGSFCPLVRNPISKLSAFFVPEHSAVRRSFSASPQPASAGFLYLYPESLFCCLQWGAS